MLSRCGVKAYVVPDTHRGFDFVAMARGALGAARSADGDRRRIRWVGGGYGAADRSVGHRAPPGGSIRGIAPRSQQPVQSQLHVRDDGGAERRRAHPQHRSGHPGTMAAAIGMTADTPMWMPSPAAHVTGLIFGVYPAMVAGAKLVLQDRWDPVEALELIERERAAVTLSATPFIAAMLDVPIWTIMTCRRSSTSSRAVPGSAAYRRTSPRRDECNAAARVRWCGGTTAYAQSRTPDGTS